MEECGGGRGDVEMAASETVFAGILASLREPAKPGEEVVLPPVSELLRAPPPPQTCAEDPLPLPPLPLALPPARMSVSAPADLQQMRGGPLSSANEAVQELFVHMQQKRRYHPGRKNEGPAKGELRRMLDAIHTSMGGGGEPLLIVELRQVTIDGEKNQRRRGFLAGESVRRWLAASCEGVDLRDPRVLALAVRKKTTSRSVDSQLAVLRHAIRENKDCWEQVACVMAPIQHRMLL